MGGVAGRNGIADAAGIHPSPSPLIPLSPKWPAKWPEHSLPSPLFCPTNCPASSHSRTSTPVESAELALGDVGDSLRGRGSRKTGARGAYQSAAARDSSRYRSCVPCLGLSTVWQAHKPSLGTAATRNRDTRRCGVGECEWARRCVDARIFRHTGPGSWLCIPPRSTESMLNPSLRA